MLFLFLGPFRSPAAAPSCRRVLYVRVRTFLLTPSWLNYQLVQSRVVSCRWLKTINMIKHGGVYFDAVCFKPCDRVMQSCHFSLSLQFVCVDLYVGVTVYIWSLQNQMSPLTNCKPSNLSNEMCGLPPTFNCSYKSPFYRSCAKLTASAEYQPFSQPAGSHSQVILSSNHD